jgi:hypothetical protein
LRSASSTLPWTPGATATGDDGVGGSVAAGAVGFDTGAAAGDAVGVGGAVAVGAAVGVAVASGIATPVAALVTGAGGVALGATGALARARSVRGAGESGPLLATSTRVTWYPVIAAVIARTRGASPNTRRTNRPGRERIFNLDTTAPTHLAPRNFRVGYNHADAPTRCVRL